MKKLLAIAIMCVLTANVAIAQNNHRRMMMRPHFENLDSAAKSHFMKMQKDFWEKQMKKNDKKQPISNNTMSAFHIRGKGRMAHTCQPT